LTSGNENRSQEQAIRDLLSSCGRLVIIGVGSSLNCDDGAGPAVAEALISGLNNDFPENITVYNGCTAPENFTGEIKRFSPASLLIVDAADFSGIPGSIKLIGLKDISGATFSSHMLPVRIMADYLEKETGCKTTLLGIQPESVQYGDELSAPVAAAVEKITKIILNGMKK
jgi:hydrogenase 3 maturation protease